MGDRKERPSRKYLWKYLDFYKFISFVQTRELYFNRLDQFEDVFEGMNIEGAIYFNRIYSSASLPFPAENDNRPDLIKRVHIERKNELIKFLQCLNSHQKKCFVSCFYMSSQESIAMWEKYSNKNGVAIRFDSKLLVNHLERQIQEISFAPVDYKNIYNAGVVEVNEKTDGDVFFDPFVKDKAFEYENEFRFTVIGNLENEFGLKVKLEDSVMKGMMIFVPTDIEDWQERVVADIVRQYLPEKKVIKSKIKTKKMIQKFINLYLEEINQK